MYSRVIFGHQFRSNPDCDSGFNLNQVGTNLYTWGFALPDGPHDPDMSIVPLNLTEINSETT